jgi:hypothetical protein
MPSSFFNGCLDFILVFSLIEDLLGLETKKDPAALITPSAWKTTRCGMGQGELRCCMPIAGGGWFLVQPFA